MNTNLRPFEVSLINAERDRAIYHRGIGYSRLISRQISRNVSRNVTTNTGRRNRFSVQRTEERNESLLRWLVWTLCNRPILLLWAVSITTFQLFLSRKFALMGESYYGDSTGA
jgi:hypothetical protein